MVRDLFFGGGGGGVRGNKGVSVNVFWCWFACHGEVIFLCLYLDLFNYVISSHSSATPRNYCIRNTQCEGKTGSLADLVQ